MLKKRGIPLVLTAILILTSCARDISEDDKNSNTDETTAQATITTLSAEELDMQKAHGILDSMTTEEKIGQLFFVRCPTESPEKQLEFIEKYHLGGYILFAADFKENSPEGVKADITSYQNASEIPMLIGIDEEGGDIVRMSKYPQYRGERFKSQSEMLENGTLHEDIIEKAEYLTSYGININLAPVADVSTDEEDYIYNRTFHVDGKETADAIKTVVEANNEVNYPSVLKHFPGYADNADTHQGIAYDKRDFETIENSDLLPFISGIQSGADAVMVSHNIIESIDGKMPASLSRNVNFILRNNLNFDGVIMTDDLSMKAITTFTNDESPAVSAFKAGNDIILQSDFEEGYMAMLNAYNSGEITEERLNESVLRILLLKVKRNIIR